MKIALSVNYIDNSPRIIGFFGSAEYFFIYDTDQKRLRERITNHFKNFVGSEVFCAQLLIKRGINSVICGSCEDNARKLFSEAKIKVIENSESSVNDFLFEFNKKDKSIV